MFLYDGVRFLLNLENGRREPKNCILLLFIPFFLIHLVQSILDIVWRAAPLCVITDSLLTGNYATVAKIYLLYYLNT